MVKSTPQFRLKEQIQSLRDCAANLSDVAPDLQPDTETIGLIAKNLRTTADNAASLLALHTAKELIKGNGKPK